MEALKRKENQTLAMTWIKIKDIRLCEISHQKTSTVWLDFYEILIAVKLTERKNNGGQGLEVVGAGVRIYCFLDRNFHFCKMSPGGGWWWWLHNDTNILNTIKLYFTTGKVMKCCMYLITFKQLKKWYHFSFRVS